MKPKYLLFLLTLAILTILLSGCAGGGATTASSWPGLTLDEETAYLAYNTFVYAIQLSNGSLKWRYPSEANRTASFYADPALSPDGQLFGAKMPAHWSASKASSPQTPTTNCMPLT